MIDLSGKVAVVTGGGSGIGKEICRFFAQSGATVVLNGTKPDTVQAAVEEIRQQGGQAARALSAVLAARLSGFAVRLGPGFLVAERLVVQPARPVLLQVALEQAR